MIAGGMTAVALDIRRLGFAFAVSAAVFAAFFSLAVATRMCAFVFSRHVTSRQFDPRPAVYISQTSASAGALFCCYDETHYEIAHPAACHICNVYVRADSSDS